MVEGLADINAGAPVKYASNSSCHLVAYADELNDVYIESCRKGIDCSNTANWTAELFVGDGVEGTAEGLFVGATVGFIVGLSLGTLVGALVG